MGLVYEIERAKAEKTIARELPELIAILKELKEEVRQLREALEKQAK